MRFFLDQPRLKRLLSLFLIAIGLFLLIFLNWPRQQHWQYVFSQVLGTADLARRGEEILRQSGRLILNSENHFTYAINEKNGKTLWRFEAQDHSPFPPTETPSCLAISSFSGEIFCLNAKTGVEVWRYLLPNETLPDTPAILSGDETTLLVGTRKGELIALERESGAELWRQQLPALDNSQHFVEAPIHFGQIAENNGQVLVVNGPSKSLLAFELTTGQQLWQNKDFQLTLEKPLFKGGYVLYRFKDELVSVNRTNGESTKLKLAPTNSWEINLIEIPSNPNLVVQDSASYRLFTPDLKTMIWQTWSIANKRTSTLNTSPLLLGQYFDLQHGTTEISYLDPETGKSLYQETLSTTPFTTTLQTPHLLLLGNSGGQLLAYDLLTHTLQFQINLHYKIHSLTFTEVGYLVALDRPGNYLGLTLIDWQGKVVWQYSPEFMVNLQNLYLYPDQVLFTDRDETLLERLPLTTKQPTAQAIHRANFTQTAKADLDHPYLESKVLPEPPLFGQQIFNKIKTLYHHRSEIWLFNFSLSNQNQVQQIIIEHLDALYANPQAEVQITAEITNQQTKKRTTIRGYYAQQNQWQVNYLPPTAGKYTVKVNIRTPFAWKREKLEFEVAETTYNPLTIQNNQFVDSQQHLFFPIGLEDAFIGWDMNGDNLDQTPVSTLLKPTNDEALYKYQNIDNHLNSFYPETGANFYRYGVGNWTPTLTYRIAEGEFIPTRRGGAFGDRLLALLKEKEIRVMMTIFDFYPPFDTTVEVSDPKNQQALRSYLDYVVARFAAQVDLWEIGNEVQSSPKFYQFVTEYLRKIDPYHHPISTNWEEPNNLNFDFNSIHLYSEPTANPATLINNFAIMKSANNNRPLIISELGYKKTSWFEESPTALRYLSWLSVFNNFGMVFWNQGQNGIFENPDNANIYLGPVEKKYLLALQQFLPTLTAPVEQNQFFLVDSEIKAFSLSDKNILLYYLINLDQGYERAYFTFPVPAGTEVELIDPKTNVIISDFFTGFDQENILLPAFAEDLAIKVYLKPNVL